MSDSATTGLRERRMAETRRALSHATRTLTAEHGLQGFTIEQVCERVGVSRRTFFNYFEAKEQAIVGHPREWFDDDAVEMFLAIRPPGDGVSVTLFDDLVALEMAHVTQLAQSRQELRDLLAAIETEPQLLQRMMKAGMLRNDRLSDLVARREGLEPGDPVASVAVLLVTTLMHSSAEIYFTPENTLTLDEIVAPRVAAARALLGGAATSQR
ncbi:TetR/AcrR family transcriptional regulator [Leifsonia sp. YIM 134122]|uniref:TetR/AcrR family transcriptional regulator n=1 Tax=Leifsonia stereocauli TaxID=3134136 RepID=A0ABU9W2Q1_9MICO